MEESRIYLRKVATGQLVEASLLDEVIDKHLALWNAAWQTAMQAHCAGRALRDKPEDHHWNWTQKADYWRPLLGYHSFAITCEGDLQGLMLVSDVESARVQAQFGKPIVYVKFLASAPWNRPEFQTPPRYRGVGTVMVTAAVELSWDLGYRGRIGLHSLPRAETFYRDTCKMTELGKDAAHQNLTYYEMTNTQAKEFRLKN
jgi:GNAT superfamily N-acetyltransferase